ALRPHRHDAERRRRLGADGGGTDRAGLLPGRRAGRPRPLRPGGAGPTGALGARSLLLSFVILWPSEARTRGGAEGDLPASVASASFALTRAAGPTGLAPLAGG